MNDTQLKQIIDAFKADPEGTLAQIPTDQQENFLQQLAQVAESTQDTDLMQMIQRIVSPNNVQSVKCGGKVRAKIKTKACGGNVKMNSTKKCQTGGVPEVQNEKCGGKAKKVKKNEAGAPVTYTKGVTDKYSSVKYGKSGCPCQLKKVGGQIIEIDGCTGMPIHREGGQITKAAFGWLVNNAVRGVGDGIGTVAGKVTEYGQKALGATQQAIGDAASAVTGGRRGNGMIERGNANRANGEATGQKVNNYIDNASAHVGNVANGAVVVGQTMVSPVWGVAGAASDYALTKGVGLYDPTTGGITKGYMPAGNGSSTTSTTPTTPSTPAYQGMFSGNMRSLNARQQWVRNNADYLKANGWTDDQIANYRGSAADNESLKSLMGGMMDWRSKQQMTASATPRVDVGTTHKPEIPTLQMQPSVARNGGIISYTSYLR